tara:strand:- start:291 stop:683 length:393 start_codon:yes stop_codon:yes gene_type:complete
MSTLKVNTIQNTSGGSSSTADQIEQGRAKAWISFDGEGTISINDSFNISSIADNATGVYTVTLSTAMSNANYCVNVSVKSRLSNQNTFANLGGTSESDPSTTAFQIATMGSTNLSATDGAFVFAAVHGDQ